MSSGAGEAGTATEPTAPGAETEAEDDVDARQKGVATEGEEKEEEGGGGILGRTVGAILGVGAAREAGEHGDQGQEQEREEHADEEPEEQEIEAGEEEGPEAVGEPEKEEDEAADEPVDTPPDADAGDRIDLNRATFEELRDVGFSVTQATRVITYRERQDGFRSLDDLAEVPGMPGTFVQEVRGKLTV